MMVGMVLVVEGGYDGASAEAPDATTKEKSELFGGIGQVIFYIFSFELLAFKFSLIYIYKTWFSFSCIWLLGKCWSRTELRF